MAPVLAAAECCMRFASCLLTPAIAALTLALCGHDAFSERLGINARYASLGSAFAAALLGGIAYYVSRSRGVLAHRAADRPGAAHAAAVPRQRPRRDDDHPAMLHPREREGARAPPWHIFAEPALHIFVVCVVLFHFANAAMLPLALNELAKRIGDTGFVVSAAIIVPQIVVALFSPWAGRLAQSIGRQAGPAGRLRRAAAARPAVRHPARTPCRWSRSRCWTASARRCSA